MACSNSPNNTCSQHKLFQNENYMTITTISMQFSLGVIMSCFSVQLLFVVVVVQESSCVHVMLDVKYIDMSTWTDQEKFYQNVTRFCSVLSKVKNEDGLHLFESLSLSSAVLCFRLSISSKAPSTPTLSSSSSSFLRL